MRHKKILYSLASLQLMLGSFGYANELTNSSSTYLLQHANNPIDWRIWSQDALEDAKKENKIIYISIGYSSCHWCHTMNKESFEDKEIAAHLNENFISIKIDREENPDVDRFYMKQITALKGSGGWPLNLFLLPTGEIITGGSYYTKKAFKGLTQRLSKLWHDNPKRLKENAKMTANLMDHLHQAKSGSNTDNQYDASEMITHLMKLEDKKYGGFGKNEKFPNVSILFYLLEVYADKKDTHIWRIIENTLDAMAYGAINDQISGGFHRYTSDREWKVPHFEKMLYDQALLIKVYAYAYQLSGKKRYKTVAKETIAYVFNALRSHNGLFYASVDAQSNGKEGSYYLWDANTLKGLDDTLLIKKLFNVSEHEPKALTYKQDSNVTLQERKNIRERLGKIQQKRPQPLIDRKVILSWNAMMIDALNFASKRFNDPLLQKQAIQAAKILLHHSRDKEDNLRRIIGDNTLLVEATLESYVYLADMSLGLYDTTQNIFWLNHAEKLGLEILKAFSDEQSGGMFDNKNTTLLGKRTKNFEDNEIPSVQGIASIVFMKLGAITGKPHYTRTGKALLHTFNLSEKSNLQQYATLFRADQMSQTAMKNNQVYSQNGTVLLTAEKDTKEVNLFFKMEQGTYINAEMNASEPISIQIDPSDAVESIIFPKAKEKAVTYQSTPLSVFEDSFSIKVKLNKENQTIPLTISVDISPCSETYCGKRETLRLSL